jgi:hypothetical protein
MLAQPESGRQVLKHRRLSVTGIPAEDDKLDPSLADISNQCFL